MNHIIIIITIFTAVKQDALSSDGLQECIKITSVGCSISIKTRDIETRSYTCFKYGFWMTEYTFDPHDELQWTVVWNLNLRCKRIYINLIIFIRYVVKVFAFLLYANPVPIFSFWTAAPVLNDKKNIKNTLFMKLSVPCVLLFLNSIIRSWNILIIQVNHFTRLK